MVKFLSTVDSRFWLRQRLAPSGIDDSIGMIWEGTDNQIGSGGIELSLFAGGPVAQNAIDSPDPWGFYAPTLDNDWRGYLQATSSGSTHFQNWEAQPFIMGGYSCPQPGEATSVWPNLFNGWADRLVFAGEHACPGFFGFMEGALESGIVAAFRLTQ
ncbi:MAG TPA: FAD-dependent oxidoreductase [Kofleriaceae bacterium]